jgi:phosphoesterase RecJ-like protein
MDEALTEQIKAAAGAVADAKSVAVTCHVNPDGDALGSALGFALAAAKAGKEVVVSFGEPFVLADSFSFLPVEVFVPPDQFPTAPEVMITFDVADRERLGELSVPAGAAETLIVVDHHITNEGFGHIDIIDPGAAATAVLAFDLIQELGWEIDADIASCLHVGLVTDTGRFQYSTTTAEVFRMAADLVESGADPYLIGRMVFENAPFAYLAVAAAVQRRAKLEAELSLVWSVLHDDDLAEAGLAPEEVEGLIDYIRIAREADVAVLLKQTPEGTKASLRSRAVVDVGSLALAFGGGGHARAAGFTSNGDPKETIEQIRGYLREH